MKKLSTFLETEVARTLAMVTVATAALCMNEADAASTKPGNLEHECEARWVSLRALHGSDVNALKQAWESEERYCAGSGVYEYHLASLAEVRGDYDAAISILNTALEKNMPRRDQLYVTKLGMEFNKADAARPRDLEKSRKANSELEAFIERKPTFTPAIHVAASQRARLRDFKAAEALARRGLAAEPDNAYSLGALVTALAATDRCAEAKPMIRPTLERHEVMFEDYDFMMAAAFCYYTTGDVFTAEQVLLALKNKLPGAEKEESFKRLARLVLQKKANSSKE